MRHLLLAALLTCSMAAPLRADHDDFWGQVGHRIIGRVASSQLSPTARAAVRTLLPGESLGSVATWADQIRSQRPETGPWHYVNIPIWDSIFRPATVCPGGDCVIAALERQLAIVADRGKPRAERAEALKWVVHLVGDMHQPLHVGRGDDKGGNDLQVQWMKKGSNLHRVWDSEMIELEGLSYTELAASLDHPTREQVKAWQEGTVAQWAEENIPLRPDIYAVEPGDNLGYEYKYRNWATVRQQLLKGGIRLAALLNAIYG